MSINCYTQSQTLTNQMDIQLHDHRFWHDSQRCNNGIDSQHNHHYKIRTVPSVLYKPLNKHEQGTYTHALPKNNWSYLR